MTQQSSPLLLALSKSYEYRQPNQHKLICQAIHPFFPTLSPRRIKVLTFYLQLIIGPIQITSQNYTPYSFIILLPNNVNPEQKPTLEILKNKKVQITSAEIAVVLDYQKYVNCNALGETSIQKQLLFWESSEYFCSMPRKKIIQLMREAKILNYAENQCPYFEGQQLTSKQSGSGVYIVRSGEFGYFKKIEGKQVETSRFGSGHIFGALELIDKHSRERVMTVKCKTHTSIVYNFQETVFSQLMQHYCEEPIRQKQRKLNKFIPSQVQIKKSKSLSINIKKINSLQSTTSTYPLFSSTQDFNSVSVRTQGFSTTIRGEFPSLKQSQVKLNANTSFYKNHITQSQKIEEQGLKKTNYWSLKKDGPLKAYPLTAQRSNFTSSEFNDTAKLFVNRKDMIGQQKVQKSQSPIWKRDMLYSFYRQNLYEDIKRKIQNQ